MVKRHTVKFHITNSPINDAVTKFGGQPNWLEPPQWPMSAELDSPMRFICQIKLTDELFPGFDGKIAYIFMTESDEYVDGTWEPDGRENAVVIQPQGCIQTVVKNLSHGPTLQKYVDVEGENRRKPNNVELSVELLESEDPEFIPIEQRLKLASESMEKYSTSLEGNKIGGTPGFIQGDEFPNDNDDWILLMQLDSCLVPFYVNFGDAGVAYVFINSDATVGKFLWQCG